MRRDHNVAAASAIIIHRPFSNRLGRDESKYDMSIASDMEIVQAYLPRCNWPRLYYGVVAALAEEIQAHAVLEVGVAFGYHAENILGSLKSVRYYGVDPYKAGYDENDVHEASVRQLFQESDPQRAVDRLYRVVKRKLNAYGGRAKLYRGPSVEAADRFESNFFDLIFVDGNHTHDAVKMDLVAWWPKLKPNGILCGDDYVWPGVKQAVDEFALASSIAVRLVAKTGTNYPIWIIRKPS
jgi:predicted O-methyltransferase YrrM